MANRKRIWSLSALASLLEACGQAVSPEVPIQRNNGSKLLAKLPMKLTNATVKKYDVVDALYCYIHVRQRHAPNETYLEYVLGHWSKEDAPVLEKEFDLGEASQKNVASIVQELGQIYGANYMYAEGIVASDISGIPSDIKITPVALQERYNEAKKLLEKCAVQFNLPPKERVYLPGATLKLGGEGIFEVLITQQWDSKKKIVDFIAHDPLFQKHGKEEEFMRLEEELEDDTLEIVGNGSSALAITVYGFDHDFWNNIQYWNKKHPEKKIALAVITPANL